MSARKRAGYSAARIAARVAELSKEISREFEGRRLDVIVTMYRGVTQDFLLRRLGKGRPCCFRPAVLRDKPGKRRLALEPDYFEFRTASNEVWVGYGLAARNGTGRNQQPPASGTNNSSRKSGKGREKKA